MIYASVVVMIPRNRKQCSGQQVTARMDKQRWVDWWDSSGAQKGTAAAPTAHQLLPTLEAMVQPCRRRGVSLRGGCGFFTVSKLHIRDSHDKHVAVLVCEHGVLVLRRKHDSTDSFWHLPDSNTDNEVIQQLDYDQTSTIV